MNCRNPRYWYLIAIVLMSFATLTLVHTSPMLRPSPKKSLIKSATALRWLRREFGDSSTPSPVITDASVNQLTLAAFCVSLLRMLIPSLNENMNGISLSPPRVFESEKLQSARSVGLEKQKSVNDYAPTTSFPIESCSQRARCDTERKWRYLTSSIRSLVDKSFRNTTSTLELNNFIWEPPFRPHKDVCELLYPECSGTKFSKFLISIYLDGAAKLSHLTKNYLK